MAQQLKYGGELAAQHAQEQLARDDVGEQTAKLYEEVLDGAQGKMLQRQQARQQQEAPQLEQAKRVLTREGENAEKVMDAAAADRRQAAGMKPAGKHPLAFGQDEQGLLARFEGRAEEQTAALAKGMLTKELGKDFIRTAEASVVPGAGVNVFYRRKRDTGRTPDNRARVHEDAPRQSDNSAEVYN